MYYSYITVVSQGLEGDRGFKGKMGDVGGPGPAVSILYDIYYEFILL